MPTLRMMNYEGDEVLEWTRERDEQIAREEFDKIVGNGGFAYRVDAPGRATHLLEFDPDAEEIVFHQPLVGG